MDPKDIETMLSMSLDDELDAAQKAELATILEDLPDYRALLAELKAQKAQCELPTPEPPDRLYQTLRRRILRTYPAKRRRGFQWQTWVGVAAVAVLAFSVGYLVPKPTQAEVHLADLPQMEQTILNARREFHSAIEQLEELAQAQIAQMPPEVAKRVKANLLIVDNAIRACEDFAQAYPDQYTAYASLAKAYQAKVDLLETLVDGSQQRS